MKPFSNRTEAKRIALTEWAIEQRVTLLQRWSALADPEANSWNARAAAAGEWLAGEDGVLDLGCGNMALERFVGDARYFPWALLHNGVRGIP